MKINKYTHFVTFARLSGLLLIVFAFFSIVPPIPTINNKATAAETHLFDTEQTPASLIFVINNNEAQIDLMPNSSFISSDIVFTTTTNNYAGYYTWANLNTENTNLTHTENEGYYIPSITGDYNKNSFPVGYWGASLDDSTYQPLPTINQTALSTKRTEHAVSEGESASLFIGAAVSVSQASGDYTNNIDLGAATIITPYTIYFDSNTTLPVSGMPASQTGTMTSSAQTLVNDVPTCTGYTFLGWSESSSATIADFASGDTFYLDEAKDNSNITLYAIWQINTYEITFFNESAGYGSISHNAVNAAYGSMIRVNNNTIVINDTIITATPATDTIQYYYSFNSWTNNCGDTLTGNCTISASFNREVRNYTVSLVGNNSTYGSFNQGSYEVPYGTALLVSNNMVTIGGSSFVATANYGYEFASITNNCGASVVGQCTITANFSENLIAKAFANAGKEKQSGYYKMQDMTASICSSIATPTALYKEPSLELIDTRDNKVYSIAKYKDGNCWMQENLRLGGSSPISLSSDDTDITSTFTLPATITEWAETSSAPMLYAQDIQDANGLYYGYYYNYYAATAGTMTSTSATQSICPKGWTIPGFVNGIEGSKSFGDLFVSYGLIETPSSQTYIVENGRQILSSLPLGFSESGYHDRSGDTPYPNAGGYYWANAIGYSYYSTHAFGMMFFGDDAIYPQGVLIRSLGAVIKCVAR